MRTISVKLTKNYLTSEGKEKFYRLVIFYNTEQKAFYMRILGFLLEPRHSIEITIFEHPEIKFKYYTDEGEILSTFVQYAKLLDDKDFLSQLVIRASRFGKRDQPQADIHAIHSEGVQPPSEIDESPSKKGRLD
jgi:hypothetical protein